MTELIIAEEHDRIYQVWQQRGERNLSVCHVDFHCDMRGLLIDRKRATARFIDQRLPYVHRLDPGSYLAHAIMNGIVTKLRWVHDDFGGRDFDYVHCVKYESDFSALPYRLAGTKRCVPLDYAEETYLQWGGPRPDEHLDIDWDGIAHVDYDLGLVRRLMAEFLDREYASKSIFVARSPQYSNPDPALFEEFIQGLEAKFAVQAVRLPPGPAPEPEGTCWNTIRRLDHGMYKLMHKLGLL